MNVSLNYLSEEEVEVQQQQQKQTQRRFVSFVHHWSKNLGKDSLEEEKEEENDQFVIVFLLPRISLSIR